jgi:hypothetical protein
MFFLPLADGGRKKKTHKTPREGSSTPKFLSFLEDAF